MALVKASLRVRVRATIGLTASGCDKGDVVSGDEVLVVGAGPTGLMLACELALGGVRVRLLEERREAPNITRAFAVHARTLELLDARGMADELLPHGIPVYEVAPAPGASLDLRQLPTRYGMILIAPQSGTERVLQARAEKLGVPIVRGAEVVDLRDDGGAVTVELRGDGTPATLAANYVVGCDGAHSTVRRLAGIDFVGKQYQTHILLADVRLAQPPEEAMFARTNAAGAVVVVPFGDGWFRAIAWDRLREQAPLSEPVSMAEMREAFGRIAGEDFGMTEQRWSSRFLSERRQARNYRVGRVFLAGDAAHVHSPLGGQGMNTGIGDAMNLGWKLAADVRGSAPPGLLDSYEAERHPVGASVLKLTDAFNQLVLGQSAVQRAAQRIAIRALLSFPRSRRLLAGRLTGIGIAYPPSSPQDHPMTGRRMPDVDCVGDRAGTRLYELLRDGKFVLVATSGVETASADRPGLVRAVHADASLPRAVLVRPDGYVAGASDRVPTPSQLSSEVDSWLPTSGQYS
jgi:2-polyprenyl-6-methoxyphenol hydroxylase-like FAD-dependent oxidoreductase